MPSFSLRNPYFILVCAVVICVLGGTSLARMPVDMFPAMDLTVVVVATFDPGMPPEQVETSRVSRAASMGWINPSVADNRVTLARFLR